MPQTREQKVFKKQNHELNEVESILKMAQHERFYGEITITFKNGFVHLVDRHDTIKLKPFPGD
jgi:hypothetical protein